MESKVHPQLPKFFIPAMIEATSDSFGQSEKRLKSWLKNFPQNQPGQQARLLNAALAECNRTLWPERKRTVIVESLEPQIQELTHQLTKRLVGLTPPLSSRQRRVLSICLRFFEELCLHHKISIAQLMAGGKRRLQGNKSFVTHLSSGLEALVNFIALANDHYVDFRPRCWRDLHQFFVLARQAGIQDQRLTTIDRRHPTITQAYKAAVVIGIAGPLCLRLGEAAELRRNIERWSDLVKITNDLTSDDLGQFVIQPERPMPGFRAPAGISLSAGAYVFRCQLDTAQGPDTSPLPLPLARRLSNKADFPNPDLQKGGVNIEWVVGLSAAQYMLFHKRTQAQRDQETNASLRLEERSGGLAPQDDAWRVPLIDNKARDRLNQLFDQKDQGSRAPLIVTGRFDGMDATKAHIYTNTPTLPSMKIGDLLLFRPVGEGKGWQLGWVEGLLCRNNGDTWSKIAMPSGKALAAHFAPSGQQSVKAAEAILLADGNGDIGPGQLLLLPATQYRLELRGSLRVGPNAQGIQLGEARYQFADFVCCTFNLVR